MRASRRVVLGCALALGGLGLLSASSSAQPAQETQFESIAPLAGPSIPEVIDNNSNINNYYSEESIGGDAEFFFSIKAADREISKTSKRIEALYKDLLHQQDIDNPIIRTKDLPSPFSTSLFQLQTPVSTNSFDSGF